MEGFDLLRPFRTVWNFTAGTVGGMLNGMATWGSRGAIAGGAVGLFVGMASPVVYTAGVLTGGIGVVAGVMGGVIAGSLIAIAFGGVLGAVTGGFTRASRLQAREDAMLNARARARPHYASAAEPSVAERVSDSNFDRQLQQNQENESYWRDQVSAQSHGHGRG
jgi:hypothetical protein